MKKRITRSGNLSTHKESARIRTIKKLKSEVASLRESLRLEKQKALICAVQRDSNFYFAQYMAEYVLTATPETFEDRKRRYSLFAEKESAKYHAEMQILLNGYKSPELREPYPVRCRERQAIRQAATQANQEDTVK